MIKNELFNLQHYYIYNSPMNACIYMVCTFGPASVSIEELVKQEQCKQQGYKEDGV